MTAAITIRDSILATLESTFPELAGKVEKAKADVVEATPSAAVYLGEIESEPASMRGHASRTILIKVAIYRRQNDLENIFCQDAEAMEKAVYLSRKSISPDVKNLHLSNAAMEFTPDSQATEGALTLTFTAQTTKILTT